MSKEEKRPVAKYRVAIYRKIGYVLYTGKYGRTFRRLLAEMSK